MEESKFNSFNLIVFLWKKRWIFAITCVLAAVLAYVFAMPWCIKPKYQSTVILYPPRTNSLSKILTTEQNYNEKLEIAAYGIDEEVEQMLQILNSKDIKDYIIQKYNMIEHYGIDTTKKYWKTKLYNYVKDNWKFKRTDYGAIAVNVMDTDPNYAADIANDITIQLDTIKSKIEKVRAEAAYQYMLKHVEEVEKEIQRIDDSIKVLMSQGIYDYESQSERVTQQYAIAVAQGNQAAISRLKAELEKLSEYGPKYMSYRDSQQLFREYLGTCRSRLMDSKMEAESYFPQKFIVEKAYPADKKAYPKKAVIVILSVIGTFIITMMVLLVMQTVQHSLMLHRKEEDAA